MLLKKGNQYPIASQHYDFATTTFRRYPDYRIFHLWSDQLRILDRESSRDTVIGLSI